MMKNVVEYLDHEGRVILTGVKREIFPDHRTVDH